MVTTLNSRLRQWRLDQDLTLEEVSALTGISTAMLSRVERGQRQLAPLTRVQVSRRLGVPLRDLFDTEDVADDADVRGAVNDEARR